MRRSYFFLFLIILGLSGCCTSGDCGGCCSSPVRRTCCESIEPQDAATVQLAEAASSISQSLTQLSAMQQANTPTPCIYLPITRDCEMRNLVSIDWAGPIGPLLDRIGCMTCYKVRKLGVPPAIPVIVTINARNTPLADVVRDIAFQAGTRACVVVYSCERVIELRYTRGCCL